MCTSIGTSSYSDGTFVVTKLDDSTAGFGISSSNEDGNGFVDKTNVAGDIKIPNEICGLRVVSLLYKSFRFCNKITSLTLPSSLKRLESCSLTAVQNIEKLVIPASVDYISDCIDYFTVLKTFVFEKGIKVAALGNCFLRYSKNIEEFILPPCVTSIGKDLCDNCVKLVKVYYCGKANFASLSNAFNACPLKVVIVSKSYEGSSFGSAAALFLNYSICNRKIVTCKIMNRKLYESSLLLMILMIYS